MPMTSHYDFFATAPKYTEGLLLNEIKLLGAEDARETVGGVSFSGELGLAYKVCLWSRIANRVLLRLQGCKISNPDDLYEAAYKISWSEHFDPDQSFIIDFNASGSVITHSQYGAQKCKDAIVDQFRHNFGTRPDVDKLNPSIRINVHVKQQSATISIDLSGHSLHQRGYRQHNVAAPLKENLAAALLLRSGWASEKISIAPLIDPMCGSGTLPIEAALIATNTAPGLLRNDFGFNDWKQHINSEWEILRSEANQKKIAHEGLILGFDNDPRAIEAATQNAELAGVDSLITFRCQDLKELENKNYGSSGYVVTNPPYGERLSDNEKLLPLYETLGKQLKSGFNGWHASVITSEPDLAKVTRLYARRKNKLYNGNLLCTIYHFDINDKAKRKPDTENKVVRPETDSDLENRLNKNLKRLKKWANKQDICCYRVYDADLPEFNFALDIYQSDQTYLVFQEYAAPPSINASKVQRRSRIARNTVIQTMSIAPTHLFYKQRKKQQGSEQYDKILQKNERHIVKEKNCSFYVNFEDYLDTGLFLDHRMTRELIQQESKGKSFLNLFSYTGTASVHAAIGGAKTTTSVDMSATYLSWCKDNFKLNNIPLDKHKFEKANCIKWIESENNKYDFIFVDPPTFSNSKSMDKVFDVQRDYLQLLDGCARLLTENGKIIFSTNFRKFKFDETSFTSTQLADMKITDITDQTIPEDFSRNKKIHQCWTLTKK
jgi:23S rRNA (guanine2445-N2)-methyltransferase / 23S rRNA (guanine2069-N7)-methyltransferase